jgi:hypothetical protein
MKEGSQQIEVSWAIREDGKKYFLLSLALEEPTDVLVLITSMDVQSAGQ